MSSAKRARSILLALSGVLVLLGIGAVAQAAPSSPDYAISVSPTSQSVPRGTTATYTVTVTALNGFAGTVSLSTSGGPTGTTVGGAATTTVSPRSGAAATTTLSAPTTSSTATGSYTVSVNGVSGKLKRSGSTGLTVTYPVSAAISLGMTPSALSVAAGSSGVYTVTLSRTGYTADVQLRVYGSLPQGVTSATFSPAVLTGTASSSTLTVTVDPAAKAGSGTVYVVGSAVGGGSPYAYAQGGLTIAAAQGKPFTLTSAPLTGLSPGVTVPVDLLVTNPNGSDLSVTNLSVSVTATNRSTCPLADFTVRQYSGAYPLLVPAGSTRSLSQLGVPAASRPQLTMVNRPVNQDGCKGIQLALAYSGSAEGR